TSTESRLRRAVAHGMSCRSPTLTTSAERSAWPRWPQGSSRGAPSARTTPSPITRWKSCLPLIAPRARGAGSRSRAPANDRHRCLALSPARLLACNETDSTQRSMGRSGMKAVVLTERREHELLEVSDPAPAPGEVIVQPEYCGICGSDLHAPE